MILLLIVRLTGQRINNKTPEGGINETTYADINGGCDYQVCFAPAVTL